MAVGVRITYRTTEELQPGDVVHTWRVLGQHNLRAPATTYLGVPATVERVLSAQAGLHVVIFTDRTTARATPRATWTIFHDKES